MSALTDTDKIFFHANGLNQSKIKDLVTKSLHGSDGGELYLEQSFSEGFGFSDGKLRPTQPSYDEGFGLRFISGEKEGFASSDTISLASFENAAKAVKAIHTQGQDVDIILPKSRIIKPIYMADNPLESMSKQEKIVILQDIDAYMRAKDPDILDVQISMAASHQSVQIIRADGHRVADIRPMTRFNINVLVGKNGKLEQRSYSFGGRYDYTKLLQSDTLQNAADEAYRQTLVALEAKASKPSSLPIVMAPGWPAVMIHEAVGHGLEGDAIRKGSSVYAGQLGKQVAAKDVTIIDQGNLQDRRGSLNFDDEGFKTGKKVLIENGILVGHMQDQKNAKLMGEDITGNGRRQSYNHRPMPRMTNTFMESGAYTPEEVVGAVKKGVYIAGMSGGSVDTTTGKFNFVVTEAYPIENGQVQYDSPIKDVTVQGNGPEAMKNVKMIGNDSCLDSGIGVCGKAGQSVPVGIGQGTTLMHGLKISGLE